METHRVGTSEAKLDDLGGGEDLTESPVHVVVDRMVVGRQEIEALPEYEDADTAG